MNKRQNIGKKFNRSLQKISGHGYSGRLINLRVMLTEIDQYPSIVYSAVMKQNLGCGSGAFVLLIHDNQDFENLMIQPLIQHTTVA